MKLLPRIEHGNAVLGSAMIEFAVVLPVLVLLLFGFIQWGLILGASLTLRNAAQGAVRLAVVTPLLDEVNAANGPGKVYVTQAIQPLLSNPAALQFNLSSPVISGVAVRQIDLSYSFPLILRFVVPGATGSTFTLSARSVMQ